MADAKTIQPDRATEDFVPVVQANNAALRHQRQLLARLLKFSFGPPPYKANLGYVANTVTILVFCWVFFTTSSGMIDVMRRDTGDWIGVIGACIGTTAILVMLTATSMSLGSDLGALIARRQFVGERIVLKTIVTASVFIFVFSISAFFSFTYYYSNIFRLSSKKIVGEMQPMELAADVILAGSQVIATNYDAETGRIVATPAMRAYLGGLDALVQAAGDHGSQFREGVQRIQEETQANAAATAAKAASALQDAQEANRLVDEAESKISAINRVVAEIEPIVAGKESEIAALASTARQEDQTALDAAKGLDNLGASCGPNCESHRANAASARKRIATIRQTLGMPLEQRASAIKQRDALKTKLISLRRKAENANAVHVASPTIEAAKADFDATLARLADLRNQIRANPNWASIRETKPLCEQTLAVARKAKVSPTGVAMDFDCEPTGAEARDLLTTRDDAIAGRATFNQKCALDGALRGSMQAIALRIRNAPESEKAVISDGLNEAKQIVDDCVVVGKSAGLSEADVQVLLKRSDKFLRSHTMDRNRFEMSREAFLNLTPDATMAIGVAVAQDAFMFIMKLLTEIFKREVVVRERPPLPPAMDVADDDEEEADIRVMKALLRLSRPIHGDMSAFDANAVEIKAFPINVQANLVGLLNRLVRERIAYIDRRGAYMLDNRTLAGVEVRLAAAVVRANARRDDLALLEAEGHMKRDVNGVRLRGRSALRNYLSARFIAPLLRPAAEGRGGAILGDAESGETPDVSAAATSAPAQS
jgi:hypothetical protein